MLSKYTDILVHT